MAYSYFDDSSRAPTEHELQEALGRSYHCWEDLKSFLSTQFEPLAEEWKHAGKNYGWSLQLRRKKRTICYMSPRWKHFMANFALGEKAVAAARTSGLPREVLQTIKNAQRFAEGRAVRLEVRFKRDLAAIQRLAEIKMAH